VSEFIHSAVNSTRRQILLLMCCLLATIFSEQIILNHCKYYFPAVLLDTIVGSNIRESCRCCKPFVGT
jgi:hypothetical protein